MVRSSLAEPTRPTAWMLLAATCGVLFGSALSAVAQPEAEARSFVGPEIVLIDYGIICQTTPEGSRPAPETLMGEINLINRSQDMDITTRVVPAKLGFSFGVKFMRAPGGGTRDIVVTVTHPPMGDAGVERERWTATVGELGPSLNLFSFEMPYEMVKGPWSFALSDGAEVLMEQHFEVVSELAAPGVLGVCFGQDFLS